MSRRLVTLLLGLLLPLALTAMACGGGTATVTFEPAPSATTPAAPAAPPASTAPSGDSITIDLTTTSTPDFTFAPATFELEAGKSYTFNIKVDSSFHTFTVKDLDIDQALNPNSNQTVTVKVDKPGTYELICIPHRALGMVGTITVK